MRNYLYSIIIFTLTCLVNGEPYELHLKFEPPDASVEFKLRHPFNDSTNNPNYGIYKNCDKNDVEPDWGLASYSSDNPMLVLNSIEGGSKITALHINDIGNCTPIVSVLHGSAECSVEIVNWPGMPPTTFSKNVLAGEDWVVADLFCKTNMGLKIIKAKQNNNNKFVIKAEFEELGLLEKDKSIMQASLKSGTELELWMDFKNPGLNKIKKAGTIGKFGNPIKAIIKNKNPNKQKFTLKEFTKRIYKNDLVNVFVSFNNGYSGFEQIQLNKNGKYKIPKLKN